MLKHAIFIVLFISTVILPTVFAYNSSKSNVESNTKFHTTQFISSDATSTAQYAAKNYKENLINSLRELVKYNTVAKENLPSPKNPVHIAFKNELKKQALTLGLDYQDYGYVVVVGLGTSEQRLGIITHGDVQPVNPSKWAKSPFELDSTSERGKLIGRGTEDDKGAISTALYAMKAIKDKKITLAKRIELYVYMAEESDWAPLRAFIKKHSLPQTNITIDAEYPVVTAEKGYGTISMTFPIKNINTDIQQQKKSYLSAFTGGFFGSQIPEDASVVIENATPVMLATIKLKAKKQNAHKKVVMQYSYQWKNKQLTINALGKSAHSSTPQDGVNAITHLADIINILPWPNNTSGALVSFINDNLGTGLYGEKFGDIAYQDDFMGRMTVSPTVIKMTDKGIQLNINIRRPIGKSKQQLLDEINATLAHWQKKNNVALLAMEHYIGKPFVQTDAPHINTLLEVFTHFTGIKNAKPIAIGGGTNSRLFPNAVSFGPSMPNTEYTGHSEHEFITVKQLMLNLKMYTAVMIELAAKKEEIN